MASDAVSDADVAAAAARWLDQCGHKRVLPPFVQRVEYPDGAAIGHHDASWECGVYHGATLGECIVALARALGWQPSPAPAPVVLATCGQCPAFTGPPALWQGRGKPLHRGAARCTEPLPAAVVSRDAVPPLDCPLRPKETP